MLAGLDNNSWYFIGEKCLVFYFPFLMKKLSLKPLFIGTIYNTYYILF